MSEQPKTILVYVGLDLVGDGLMKLPFIRALRAAYPDAHITWLAGKGKSVFNGSLAPLVKGFLDKVLDDADIGSHVGELFSRPLGRQQFDLIIDTQRRALTTLILKRIRHQQFVSGTAGYWFSSVKPSGPTEKPKSMVAAMMALLTLAKGSPVEPSGSLDLGKTNEEAAMAILPDGPIYVGLSPGAGGKHKCWPLDAYMELARQLDSENRKAVFLLGPAESEWVEPLSQGAPHALLPLQSPEAKSAGASPLLTIALAKRLKVGVANDSGTGHMIAAADIPLISLFGPTPPEKFAPFVSSGQVIKAQDFGGEAMALIPVDFVHRAVGNFL